MYDFYYSATMQQRIEETSDFLGLTENYFNDVLYNLAVPHKTKVSSYPKDLVFLGTGTMNEINSVVVIEPDPS